MVLLAACQLAILKEEARYFLVNDPNGKVVAYTHFRSAQLGICWCVRTRLLRCWADLYLMVVAVLALDTGLMLSCIASISTLAAVHAFVGASGLR